MSQGGRDQSFADEATRLWIKAYEGEVAGEAHFDELIARTEDPGERVKLEVLAKVERSTKELLAGCMQRLGIPTAVSQSLLENARASASDFETTVGSMPAGAAEYLDYYTRLRELVEARDAHAVDLLIAHELAVELFARRERGGDGANSLQPLRALSHLWS